jgi:hypothetical protein
MDNKYRFNAAGKKIITVTPFQSTCEQCGWRPRFETAEVNITTTDKMWIVKSELAMARYLETRICPDCSADKEDDKDKKDKAWLADCFPE